MADFFKWDGKTFSIGVTAMDREHETLIGIMNRLHASNAAGAPRAELAKTIQELASYTLKHFTDEEAYLDSIQYPKRDVHKIIHKKLLDTFTQHVKAFESGDGRIKQEFFDFLKVWLSSHIQGIDRQYGDFSKA